MSEVYKYKRISHEHIDCFPLPAMQCKIRFLNLLPDANEKVPYCTSFFSQSANKLESS